MTHLTPASGAAEPPVSPRATGVFDASRFRAGLIASGELSEGDWRLASEVARQNSTTPLRALLDLGLVSEDALADRLAAHAHCGRWRPAEERGELSPRLPAPFMAAHAVLAFDDEPAPPAPDGQADPAAPGVRLVLSDLSDHLACGAVLGQFDGPVELLIASHKDIQQFLHERTASTSQGQRAGDEAVDVSGELSALRDMASEAPVVRFFNQAVERAMDLGASDIHLERFDRRVSLRFRVDGLLIEQPPPPPALYEPILCRIKIMANLDIAERRRAQDGRVPMRLRGRTVDLRVSIVPTMYGQDAAIRLQDRQRLGTIGLPDLGFSPPNIRGLVDAASRSHGILLITGPTGSGKTTTLYALLRRLVSAERKVVTVEDPVEYAMDGVNQIQVNPAVNLTFSNTLRNVLRHDPDVILIGEIRDKETAEIAFQASLTGHMVLSTLHTNDVPGTFVRLIDMGVEPYLVNAAVVGVSAQRLVRRLCQSCQNQTPARESCKHCGGLGYRGRLAIMEFSPITPAIKREVLGGADEQRLRQAVSGPGFSSLAADARRLIDAGQTDEAEVRRVLGAHAPDAALAALDEPARRAPPSQPHERAEGAR